MAERVGRLSLWRSRPHEAPSQTAVFFDFVFVPHVTVLPVIRPFRPTGGDGFTICPRQRSQPIDFSRGGIQSSQIKFSGSFTLGCPSVLLSVRGGSVWERLPMRIPIVLWLPEFHASRHRPHGEGRRHPHHRRVRPRGGRDWLDPAGAGAPGAARGQAGKRRLQVAVDRIGQAGRRGTRFLSAQKRRREACPDSLGRERMWVQQAGGAARSRRSGGNRGRRSGVQCGPCRQEKRPY